MLSQDYQELHELLIFAFNFQDALVRSLSDGKIDFSDIGNLWPLATSAAPAFKGVGNPLSRLSNLSDIERGALIELARQRFDLPNDMLEILIEDSIREVYGDYLVAVRWAKYFKKPVEPVVSA